MAYSQAGYGSPAVVFLHGTGCDATDWDEVVRHLPSAPHRITVDFRGHGASDVPAGPFTIAELATDVVALLNVLQLPQTILVGHSLGGMVAMAVVAQTRRVAGLVLLEGWTRLRAERAFAGDRLYGHLSPLEIRRIREKSDRTIRAFRPATWQAFWKSVERFDGRPCLRDAGIPMFAVYGDMGRTCSTESMLMTPANPAIRLFWIADAGHYVPHEKPLEVAGICTQMIKQEPQHGAV